MRLLGRAVLGPQALVAGRAEICVTSVATKNRASGPFVSGLVTAQVEGGPVALISLGSGVNGGRSGHLAVMAAEVCVSGLSLRAVYCLAVVAIIKRVWSCRGVAHAMVHG